MSNPLSKATFEKAVVVYTGKNKNIRKQFKPEFFRVLLLSNKLPEMPSSTSIYYRKYMGRFLICPYIEKDKENDNIQTIENKQDEQIEIII